MKKHNQINTPDSPFDWFESGVSLRKQSRFGEAINAFQSAADLAYARIAQITDESEIRELRHLIDASLANISLVKDIVLFVNKDLMNP